MDFDRLVRRFQAADQDTRLEALLDLAGKLSPLPERFRDARERVEHRVPECQTPVYLWLEADETGAHLYADVPRESPTVRGFVALLARGLEGMALEEVERIPADLIDRLRLSETLGMTRMQGLSAILGRVKRMAREGLTSAPAPPHGTARTPS